jgi:hypothetical protein
MKSIAEINSKIIDLWDNTSEEIRGPLMPSFLAPAPTSCILFIGFNPSFAKRYKGTIIEEKLTYLPNTSLEKANELAEYDKKSFESYPYFRKMKGIASQLKLSWDHLDPFFMRHPNQKYAESLVISQKGETLTHFGASQFALFKAALKLATPRVVVVANARSSSIIKRELKLEKKPSELFYTSRDFNCPIHLGSMISGQRAMDVFSVERLQSAIQQSIN